MRPFLNAVLAASLVLAPTASVAAGSPAPPTMDAQARASTSLEDPNQQIDDNWWLIGGGILLILLLIFLLFDDDDEDVPVSP